MITRWSVVLVLYYSLAFATPNVRRSQSSASLSSMSAAPIGTELPVVLAPNHSAMYDHSIHRRPLNATHHPITDPPTTTSFPSPGQTAQPGDVTPSPGSDHDSVRKGPGIAQIFFEVLGGVIGGLLILGILRCLYVYKKTPSSRRPPGPEVSEVDRTMALLRNPPWRPLEERAPPPPYQSAPEYNTVMGRSASPSRNGL